MARYETQDSEAVLALKARLAFGGLAKYERKWLYSRIRRQRLLEAREKGTHTEAEWLRVLERYDYRCVQCGCVPVGRPCKDHIIPIHQGGSDGLDNLQPLCRECNTGKGPDNFNWAAYRDEHGFADVDEPFDQEAF